MIAIHAGAGYDGGPERSIVVLQTLRRALAIGKSLIRRGHPAADVATATVEYLEQQTCCNCGPQGSNLTYEPTLLIGTQDGISELDACVSDSNSARSGLFGAVAGVVGKHPVAGALRVLRRAQEGPSSHGLEPPVFVCGRGAQWLCDEPCRLSTDGTAPDRQLSGKVSNLSAGLTGLSCRTSDPEALKSIKNRSRYDMNGNREASVDRSPRTGAEADKKEPHRHLGSPRSASSVKPSSMQATPASQPPQVLFDSNGGQSFSSEAQGQPLCSPSGGRSQREVAQQPRTARSSTTKVVRQPDMEQDNREQNEILVASRWRDAVQARSDDRGAPSRFGRGPAKRVSIAQEYHSSDSFHPGTRMGLGHGRYQEFIGERQPRVLSRSRSRSRSREQRRSRSRSRGNTGSCTDSSAAGSIAGLRVQVPRFHSQALEDGTASEGDGSASSMPSIVSMAAASRGAASRHWRLNQGMVPAADGPSPVPKQSQSQRGRARTESTTAWPSTALSRTSAVHLGNDSDSDADEHNTDIEEAVVSPSAFTARSEALGFGVKARAKHAESPPRMGPAKSRACCSTSSSQQVPVPQQLPYAMVRLNSKPDSRWKPWRQAERLRVQHERHIQRRFGATAQRGFVGQARDRSMDTLALAASSDCSSEEWKLGGHGRVSMEQVMGSDTNRKLSICAPDVEAQDEGVIHSSPRVAIIDVHMRRNTGSEGVGQDPYAHSSARTTRDACAQSSAETDAVRAWRHYRSIVDAERVGPRARELEFLGPTEQPCSQVAVRGCCVDGSEDRGHSSSGHAIGRKRPRCDARGPHQTDCADQRRKKRRSEVLKQANAELDRHRDSRLDTVGVTCIDLDGVMAVASSSGGHILKPSGRIGSAAIYGAGTYIDVIDLLGRQDENTGPSDVPQSSSSSAAGSSASSSRLDAGRAGGQDPMPQLMCAGMASGRGEAIIRMQTSKACCEAVADALETVPEVDGSVPLDSMAGLSHAALHDETGRLLARVARRGNQRRQAHAKGAEVPVMSVPELGVVTVAVRAGVKCARAEDASSHGAAPAASKSCRSPDRVEILKHSTTEGDMAGKLLLGTTLWKGLVQFRCGAPVGVSVCSVQTAPRFAVAVGCV